MDELAGALRGDAWHVNSAFGEADLSHEICVICVCCPDGLRVSIQYPAPDWVHCQTEAKHLEGGALLAAFCAFDVVNRSFMIGEAVSACVVYYCSTYYEAVREGGGG